MVRGQVIERPNGGQTGKQVAIFRSFGQFRDIFALPHHPGGDDADLLFQLFIVLMLMKETGIVQHIRQGRLTGDQLGNESLQIFRGHYCVAIHTGIGCSLHGGIGLHIRKEAGKSIAVKNRTEDHTTAAKEIVPAVVHTVEDHGCRRVRGAYIAAGSDGIQLHLAVFQTSVGKQEILDRVLAPGNAGIEQCDDPLLFIALELLRFGKIFDDGHILTGIDILHRLSHAAETPPHDGPFCIFIDPLAVVTHPLEHGSTSAGKVLQKLLHQMQIMIRGAEIGRAHEGLVWIDPGVNAEGAPGPGILAHGHEAAEAQHPNKISVTVAAQQRVCSRGLGQLDRNGGIQIALLDIFRQCLNVRGAKPVQRLVQGVHVVFQNDGTVAAYAFDILAPADHQGRGDCLHIIRHSALVGLRLLDGGRLQFGQLIEPLHTLPAQISHGESFQLHGCNRRLAQHLHTPSQVVMNAPVLTPIGSQHKARGALADGPHDSVKTPHLLIIQLVDVGHVFFNGIQCLIHSPLQVHMVHLLEDAQVLRVA